MERAQGQVIDWWSSGDGRLIIIHKPYGMRLPPDQPIQCVFPNIYILLVRVYDGPILTTYMYRDCMVFGAKPMLDWYYVHRWIAWVTIINVTNGIRDPTCGYQNCWFIKIVIRSYLKCVCRGERIIVCPGSYYLGANTIPNWLRIHGLVPKPTRCVGESANKKCVVTRTMDDSRWFGSGNNIGGSKLVWWSLDGMNRPSTL